MQNLHLNTRTADQSLGAVSYWLCFGEVQVYLEEAVSSFFLGDAFDVRISFE